MIRVTAPQLTELEATLKEIDKTLQILRPGTATYTKENIAAQLDKLRRIFKLAPA